jgi:hypothetical protein
MVLKAVDTSVKPDEGNPKAMPVERACVRKSVMKSGTHSTQIMDHDVSHTTHQLGRKGMKRRHEIFSTIIWDYKNKEKQSISPNPLYSTNARHMNEANRWKMQKRCRPSHLPASGAAVTTLTSSEPFGQRGGCVTITLSLSGVTVHLLLTQLVQTLGLAAGNLAGDTILTSVHATNTASAGHGA